MAGGINTYAYVEGNPISNFDPFGLFLNTTARSSPAGSSLRLPRGVQPCLVCVRNYPAIGPETTAQDNQYQNAHPHQSFFEQERCPITDNEQCRKLYEKIENIRKNIRRRERDLIIDINKLPWRADNEPLRASKYGHYVLMDIDWQNLKYLELMYIDKCLSKK